MELEEIVAQLAELDPNAEVTPAEFIKPGDAHANLVTWRGRLEIGTPRVATRVEVRESDGWTRIWSRYDDGPGPGTTSSCTAAETLFAVFQ